ncbi:glycine betaine ABC transporter substrate-binding protein OsmF [Salinarimonas ramus]|uniref:ABC transporter substrate-binding protein n=1 Tax=Salinarimonas ramus TaxID=690164 RepID=A0A917Q6D1_9HYPH|nr:ABC transporter substrate-binding protein [Salinarimonas ramus]GGK28139.1 ABC transporter substrate-binding protein [Salinarimonas ramus]
MRPVTTILAAAAFLAGGAGLASAQVVVSSKIDTEGGVLGNIILQVLDDAGIETQNRLQLGGTPIVREAITAGEIDVYPEYTGNAAFFFNEADSDVWKSFDAGYERAAELDREANDIVWLQPSPANNTWAIAVRSEIAEANGLETLSDFGEWIAGGGEVILAASSEFVNSPAALPAFQETYGFTLSPDQLITLSGGDTAATIAAAARQTSGANAAMVYGTDGGIGPSGLVVMEDDQGVQPVYAPAPLVRAEVLEEYPQLPELLNPVFQALTLETLQELNGRVQVGGEAASAVARDFLTREGFVE